MNTADERAALMRAILTQPDDNTPRLVFADWLDEQGEPSRATFIREHIKRRGTFRLDNVARHAEDGLPRAFLAKWFGTPVGEYPRGYLDYWRTVLPEPVAGERWGAHVRCGFVSIIELPVSAFVSPGWAKTFFQIHPVTMVWLTDSLVFPSGGNDTFYLGGLGRFPQKFWSRLEGHSTIGAVREAASAVCVEWGREEAGLPPLPPREPAHTLKGVATS